MITDSYDENEPLRCGWCGAEAENCNCYTRDDAISEEIAAVEFVDQILRGEIEP